MAKNYLLKDIKVKKDKQFDTLSKSNLLQNKRNKDAFDIIKKDKTIGQANKPRAASKKSVKQFGK